MAQIEFERKITYRWWNDEKEIDTNHIGQLEEEAIERINSMLVDDYTSGELNTEIEGVYYNGWWELNSAIL